MKKRDSEIARRYAVAVFELAQSEEKIVNILEELKKVSKYSFVVTESLSDPSLLDDAKRSILDIFISTLELSTMVGNFLKLVLQNHRVNILPLIIAEFFEKVDNYMGICRGDVFSASPLNPEILTEFESLFSNKMGKKVFLAQKLDEALLAGYVFKLGGTVLDASLKTRLQQLRETLNLGV